MGESASQVSSLSPRMIGRSFIWASRRMGTASAFSDLSPKCSNCVVVVRLIPDLTPSFPCTKPISQARVLSLFV